MRSLLVVHHGRLVEERYFNGSSTNDAWNIKSASKSMLSALTGIALKEGYLQSIDEPVMDFFPEYRSQLNDPRKDRITIRHLLTMTAGLEFTENGPICFRWLSSPDRIGFTLKTKVVAEPGTESNYSTALTHLLSAVLTKATGTNTLAFARRALFDPIGVTVGRWDQDQQGYYFGGSEMYLTPRDMAKFGYLYLNGGQWDGKQIVPADWVRFSTQPHTNYMDYGFLWWLDAFDGHPMYFAQGLGGQHIAVVPDFDVVVVTTAWLPTHISALSFIKVVLLPCMKPPQDLTSDLPPAQQVVNSYFAAIGAREELSKLKSLRIAGTVEIPAIQDRGRFELWKGGSGRIYSNVTQERRREGTYKYRLGTYGSNGRIVWATVPKDYRIVEGEQARPWREDAGDWCDLRGPLSGMQTVALTPFEGKLCYQLQSVLESREVVTDFYDRETGLLAGSIRLEAYPGALVTLTRVFNDYQQFGPLKFPTRIIWRFQGPEIVWTRTAVQYNTVNPRAFDLPIPVVDILRGKRESAE